MRIVLVVLVVAAAGLGWGYWHAASHGELNLRVYDVSLRNDRQLYAEAAGADVTLTDAAGTVLAKAGADQAPTLLSIYSPEIGNCRREERAAFQSTTARDAWRRCFKNRSRWLMTWVPQARYASVKLGKCSIARVPVSMEEFREDWWLWWVPLPHVGGAPYTYFQLTLWVDGANCRPAQGKA
jgi:hypothetical protein